MVGFAPMPFTAKLQPQRAAVTAVLKITKEVFTCVLAWLIRFAAVIIKHSGSILLKKGHSRWYRMETLPDHSCHCVDK